MSIENITVLHLDLNNASQDAERSPLIAQILFTLKDILVTTSGNETFYNISYDQIAKVIFEKECRIDEESLLNLKTLVKYELGKLFVYTGWCEEEERLLQFKKDHLFECYSKLVTHIHLSYIQKNFIEISAQRAFSLAHQASELATDSLAKSTSLANEINIISTNANMAVRESIDASDKALRALGDAKEATDKSHAALENVNQARIDIDTILDSVSIAQKNANSAVNQANLAREEAENTSKNITTQFVTILGIFASIIVALFGGMSLIRAAVELLTNDGSLPVFVFVVAVLLLSFIVLIVLLTSWITSLNTKKDSSYNLMKGVIILGLLVIIAVSGGFIFINDNSNINKPIQQKANIEFKITTDQKA